MAQKVETPNAKKVIKTVSSKQQMTSEMPPESTSTSSSPVAPSRVITAEKRHQMIAEAAYAMAEQRGFEGVAVMDDWLQAEAQVDNQIAAGDVR